MARRRRHHHRRHRNPPEISTILHHPGDVIMPPLVAAVSAYTVVTVGNYVSTNFLATYLPTSLPGTATDVITKAAVRAGVAWGGDYLVKRMGPRYVTPYRIGAGLGILGSAVLEFLGKSFILGMGDEAQLPGGVLAGTGAYIDPRMRALRGAPAGVGGGMGDANGVGAYLQQARQQGGVRLRGVSGRNAFDKLYGNP